MQPSQSLALSAASSIPVITAVATLIAAGIGAVVALAVAYTNAWSARRIAIDTAHRAYRTQLAEPSLAALRLLLSQMDQLELTSRDGDFVRWCRLVSEVAPRKSLRQDLPTTSDKVFAAAVRLFVQRRGLLGMWLRIASKDRDSPPFGMTEAMQYVTEAAEVLQTAAEAYIFDLPKLRRRAARMLKGANPLALKKRIDARRKIYEDAFGPDDGEAIDIDQIPEELPAIETQRNANEDKLEGSTASVPNAPVQQDGPILRA